jgi:hypothetical protein
MSFFFILIFVICPFLDCLLHSWSTQTHTQKAMQLHYGDLTDSSCLVKIMSDVKPTEVFFNKKKEIFENN